MSDHLPECLTPDPASPEILCICDRLRACEQRVFQEQIEGRQRDMVMAYLRGYAAALDAAREAVAASWTGWCSDPTTCTDYEHVCQERHQALAAIDALRDTPTRISGQDPL